MATPATPRVFISHTADDKPLADALNAALRKLFAGRVDVRYSTSKEESGVAPGANWFEWIVNQVVACDVAYVLLTPASIQRPWIPWEAGAVYGAALSRATSSDAPSGVAAMDRGPVQPLLFHVDETELPDPFHTLQFARGDRPDDMKMVLNSLRRGLKHRLPEDVFDQSLLDLDATLQTLIAEVEQALKTAPLTPTEAAVQEWCRRLDDLRAQQRFSEAKQLHGWLELAFGREDELGFGAPEEGHRLRPLDLRIHRRLGELYLDGNNHAQAARQFELCRKLAPRDLFVLRSLGQAYIGYDLDEAERVMTEMVELDEHAFEDNAECAGLRGRWLVEKGRLPDARLVYERALERSPDSYWLAGRLAQTLLDLDEPAAAKLAFAAVRRIIEGLAEQNRWTHADAANAALAMGDRDGAIAHLAAVARFAPTDREVESIERGLRALLESLGRDPGEIEPLRAALAGSAAPAE